MHKDDAGLRARSSRCSGGSWQALASGPALAGPRVSAGAGGQRSPLLPAGRAGPAPRVGTSLVLFPSLPGSCRSLRGFLLWVWGGKRVTATMSHVHDWVRNKSWAGKELK